MPSLSRIGLCLIVFLLPLTTPDSAVADAYVAIIIDDIGNNRLRGERAINLPGELTYAVIPETAHGKQLARYAHETGKEVMLHLPMENTRHAPLGDLALTSDLTYMEFVAVIETAIAEVPFASGMNNHMGSFLTQQPEAMRWLMEVIQRHQYYFVDSRTTNKTVASRVASELEIETTSRDIFLDNVVSPYAIHKQFQKLIRLAKRDSTAVAIGHPHRATLDYLELAIPHLEREGVKTISVSELIRMRKASRRIAMIADRAP